MALTFEFNVWITRSQYINERRYPWYCEYRNNRSVHNVNQDSRAFNSSTFWRVGKNAGPWRMFSKRRPEWCWTWLSSMFQRSTTKGRVHLILLPFFFPGLPSIYDGFGNPKCYLDVYEFPTLKFPSKKLKPNIIN